jgi:hypothetical protein
MTWRLTSSPSLFTTSLVHNRTASSKNDLESQKSVDGDLFTESRAQFPKSCVEKATMIGRSNRNPM